jgi:predicted lipid-binding transport protein (Tim44 family)
MSAIRSVMRFLGVASAVLALAVVDVPSADARVGGGFSVGSRGFKTYSPPPSTRTAPGATQPMQRSATPSQAARPTAAPVSGSRFGTGFMGGLLGAGLFGLLLGGGLFGGLGGLLGFLGLIAQVVIIGWLGSMVWAYFRNRNQPVAALGNGYQRASLDDRPQSGSGGPGMGAAPPTGGPTKPLTIEPADFTSFERLLSVIQLSFGREDVAALRSATTQEMLGYFTEQLEDNARKGVHNELSDVKLLSGDLAEAWSEPSGDYATVAMRYSLLDATVQRANGAVVAGSRTARQDVTEVWTFTRRLGGGPNAWRLSAIQQVS